MANAVYPKFLENLLSGTAYDLTDGSLKMVLVDLDNYTYDAAHDFLDDVSAGARVATSGALQNVTVTSGKFNADNITLSSVPANDSVEAVILYYDNGSGAEASSPLIAYWDNGISVTPDGNNIIITIPTDAFTI